MTVIIRDPIYKIIEIEDEFLPIIDNPYFQRLRNIKQDSLLFYVYPSAKHDRFTHCLGAYHLMKQVVNNGLMPLSDKDKFNLKAAALLHDIGHGPYSHLWEHMISNFDHEEFGSNIIREVFNLPQVAAIIEKKHPFSKLLSSVIDIDKLDYMARDSYFCGVGYGYADVERIVRYISVVDDKVIIPHKIVPSVEHVISGRISLYKSTYYHESVRAKDALMKSIFSCAKDLYQTGEEIFVDELLARFFDGTYNVADFLSVDDSTLEYHFQIWRKSSNPVIRDLLDRFFSRRGFIAKDIDVDSNYNYVELKERVRKKFLLNYYYYEDSISKGVYENEVYVKDGDSLSPLSKVSKHIAGISNIPIEKKLIIFPKELV